jgi:hypothetical protein
VSGRAPSGRFTFALPLLVIAALCVSCSGSRHSGSPQRGELVSKGEKRFPVHPGNAERLPVLARTRGPNDPHDFDLALLIPRGSRLRQVWFIHGGKARDQVLVEWIRSKTVSLYGEDFSDSVRWGLTLWTQTPPRPADNQAPWEGVAIPLLRLSPGSPNMRVAFADVTSDGHPDVLVEQYPHTNHDCGPHEVVATFPRRGSWRIFRTDLCETPLDGSHGLLALDLPYYVDGDSMCCWSKVEKVRLRWNGQRFVKASDRIVAARASVK